MRSLSGAAWGVLSGLSLVGAAAGQDISFTPDDGPGVISHAYQHVLPGGVHTTEYVPFGVNFTGFSIGAYDGNPDRWSWIDGDGIIGLDEWVAGRIVVPETGKPGVTDLVEIAAGPVGSPEDIYLAVFNSVGKLIGDSIADDGVSDSGDLVARVAMPGIASFMVISPTEQAYGVSRIGLDTPVPAPGAGLMLPFALSVLGRRRRR